MREEAERYGMKFSPYPPYEILATKDISYNELLILKKVEEMVDKYYNSQKFNNIIKFLINSFNTPYEFYLSLGEFFDKNGYFNRNIGNNEYYKVFLDFNEEITMLDKEALKDIIKYDYLSFNKRRGMPEFLFNDMNKEEEKYIREQLKEKYTLKKYHIEKFKINIKKFINEQKIKKETEYYLFGFDGEIINVSNEIS